MKLTNLEKTKPSIEYLGCSAEYFKEYIKSKMTEGMTFDNIHFDHIKPVSRFNLEDEEELLKCCHYTNFQPLLITDNLEKSNKWSKEEEEFWNLNICGKEYKEIYNVNKIEEVEFLNEEYLRQFKEDSDEKFNEEYLQEFKEDLNEKLNEKLDEEYIRDFN
jgi:hypothetical protein